MPLSTMKVLDSKILNGTRKNSSGKTCRGRENSKEKQRIADSKPTVEEEFHPNGELKRRTNYQSKDDGGKRHGLSREWHENGQLYTEQTYNNGKRYGLYRHWTTEGQLYLEETYKNGQRHGLTLAWEGDGSLLMKQCFSNDKTVDMSNCQE